MMALSTASSGSRGRCQYAAIDQPASQQQDAPPPHTHTDATLLMFPSAVAGSRAVGLPCQAGVGGCVGVWVGGRLVGWGG